MKILVVSDSHDYYQNLKKAAEKEKDIDGLLFLGDGREDYDMVVPYLPIVNTYRVRGNNDWDGSIPLCTVAEIGGRRFFMCHGHSFGVNRGLDSITEAAIQNNCTCALFGHTHCRHYSFERGIHRFNPGSVSLPRDGQGKSYGIITEEKGKLDFYYGNI